MFLLSAQNNIYVEFICRRACEKKSEFHVVSWFPGLQNLSVFLENSFSGRTNSLKPPVSRFCDSLPFGLEESRELMALLD